MMLHKLMAVIFCIITSIRGLVACIKGQIGGHELNSFEEYIILSIIAICGGVSLLILSTWDTK